MTPPDGWGPAYQRRSAGAEGGRAGRVELGHGPRDATEGEGCAGSRGEGGGERSWADGRVESALLFFFSFSFFVKN